MSLSSRPESFAHNMNTVDEIWTYLKDSANGGNLKADQHFTPLCRIAAFSPYSCSIIKRYPDFACAILMDPQDRHYDQIIEEISQFPVQNCDKNSLMSCLRDGKNKVALLTAFMDVNGYWSLDDVTNHLTDFAEQALRLATQYSLHEAHARGDINWNRTTPNSQDIPSLDGCGYFILAMGKMGGRELNYSSDIDLIIFYDPDKLSYTGRKSLKDCLIKVTQQIVELMDRRTMAGYVFRTDLRLRPDPGSTPIAMTTGAAFSYYHSYALNWERSAMIKARPVAGDIKAGEEFLGHLSSWIWRRNMDYEAMGDIIAMKEQINRHEGQSDFQLQDFNVKLGRGGIREIEFYTHINQLLLGGRHPEFRLRPTLLTLEQLANHGRIKGKDCSLLTAAYDYLRMVEHRIQMINDEQTHTVPSDEAKLQNLCLFCGHDTVEDFEQQLKLHTQNVAAIYDGLLPKDASANDDHNPVNIQKTLEALNFQDTVQCQNMITAWSRGKYRSLQTSRARNILQSILPDLLTELSKNSNPDKALTRFDKFISQLPAGVQIFSMLQANPFMFKLIARIMSLAPALADLLAKRSQLWDSMLEPDFFEPIADKQTLKNQLSIALNSAKDYQDILDICRRWTNEKRFQVAVQTLEGLSDIEESGPALTLITDVCLQSLLPLIEQEFAEKYGHFPGGGIAMIAMGKYGGKELTFTSDLDVVFLYQVKDMTDMSMGPKQLGPSQYFSRLGQHIITAITALTPEGRLFEVDTRLRPSGSQGPLVVTINTFKSYYQDSAWTWEHMALTRARIIHAPKGLKTALMTTIHDTLSCRREGEKLKSAVLKMRRKLYQQFGSDTIWNIKHTSGGLVDVEFFIQYLLLKHGHNDIDQFPPEINKAANTLMRQNIISEDDYSILINGHKLQLTLQSILRISMDKHPKSADMIPDGLKEILCKTADGQTFRDVEIKLTEVQKNIHTLYIQYIGDYLQSPDD